MTILLQHPITEKPKKPGEYWIKRGNIIIIISLSVEDIEEWDVYTKHNPAAAWYEEIELPDDAIIVQ